MRQPDAAVSHKWTGSLHPYYAFILRNSILGISWNTHTHTHTHTRTHAHARARNRNEKQKSKSKIRASASRKAVGLKAVTVLVNEGTKILTSSRNLDFWGPNTAGFYKQKFWALSHDTKMKSIARTAVTWNLRKYVDLVKAGRHGI